MGRTRPKNRKARPPIDDPAERDGKERSEPTLEALLEKAQELIVQCDYDLAGRFIDRVLKRTPDNAVAKEMLGVVQLETGILDAAKQVCLHATFDVRLASKRVLLDFLITAAPKPRRTVPHAT